MIIHSQTWWEVTVHDWRQTACRRRRFEGWRWNMKVCDHIKGCRHAKNNYLSGRTDVGFSALTRSAAFFGEFAFISVLVSFHNFLQILACKKINKKSRSRTNKAGEKHDKHKLPDWKEKSWLFSSVLIIRDITGTSAPWICLCTFFWTLSVFSNLSWQPSPFFSRVVQSKRRAALCCLRCDDPWCHPGVLIWLLTCISARSAGDWLAGASGTNYGAWCIWDYVSPDCSLIIVTLSAGSPRSAFGSVASVYLHVLSCTLKTPTSSTHAHHTLTLLFWLFHLILTS